MSCWLQSTKTKAIYKDNSGYVFWQGDWMKQNLSKMFLSCWILFRITPAGNKINHCYEAKRSLWFQVKIIYVEIMLFIKFLIFILNRNVNLVWSFSDLNWICLSCILRYSGTLKHEWNIWKKYGCLSLNSETYVLTCEELVFTNVPSTTQPVHNKNMLNSLDFLRMPRSFKLFLQKHYKNTQW